MGDQTDCSMLSDGFRCGLISTTPDGIITSVNHTLAEWLRVDGVDLLGIHIFDLLKTGSRIAFETHILPLLRMQGYVEEISLDFRSSEGPWVPFIANISEHRSPEAEHIAIRFALFRFLDRRLYEEALLKARSAAESKARREKETAIFRDRFISVLGHDLRNPLTAIISGVNILKRSPVLVGRDRVILDGIGKSAWRAEALIQDVLDFARGSLGDGLKLNLREAADLDETLTQVIDEVRTINPDQLIVTDINIGYPILCDAARVSQVLANLLSNAVNYGDCARGIEVTAFTDETCLTLSVSNFGEPIPVRLQQNLFRPFHRGDVKGGKDGLGLGLFIASEIAKSHDGTLEVMSDKELTRFTMKIPSKGSAPAH